MARYKQSYVGDRRTASVHVQLTPDERVGLEAAAAGAGACLSAYVRALCLCRAGEVPRVEGPRRSHPDAQRLFYELNAIGNNLNQLTRIANTHRALPAADELRAITRLVREAMARVIAL